jgi:hypothetical protein
MSRVVVVTNMTTLQKVVYDNLLTVERNVLNAYMQVEQKDFNWWNYDNKNHPPIENCKETVVCGDWSAFKDGHQFQAKID